MKLGPMLASQCSAFLCFILNFIILETNRLFYFIYPHIHYTYKKCLAPLPMLNYNYADRRPKSNGHQLTHFHETDSYIYIYISKNKFVLQMTSLQIVIWKRALHIYIYKHIIHSVEF